MYITNLYYDFLNGEFPYDDNHYKITDNTLKYLLEAGFCEEEIVKLIFENKIPDNDFLTPDMLPEELWEGSLLTKNTFYYHKQLQIVSPGPTWNPLTNTVISYPFYLEMRIRYTEKDILNYFIRMFNIEYIHEEKELASIKYLLNKYSKFAISNHIKPVDILLHLIDYCSSIKNGKLYQVYDICEYEGALLESLELDIKNAISNKKNIIVWRK